MNLYPAILTESEHELQAYLDVCQAITAIETVQIDVVDGSFADNLTLTPLDLVSVEWGRLQADLHFMVDEPMDFVYELVALKDQLPVRAVIAQVEKMSFQADYLEEVRKQGWQVGLALDIFTPLDAIEEDSWRSLDVLLLLGVEAGFQHQQLKEQLFAKLKAAKALCAVQDHPIELIADGGITLDNATQVLAAGADGLAVGSALWKNNNIPATVAEFAA